MKQEKEIQYADNFNKKEGTFLYDNKRDEMLLNVLDLYPDKTTFFFKGVKGNQKKKELQDKVRSVFDQSVTEIEAYENAGGSGRRRLRDALRKVGRGIATASLAPARGAALALIRLNFRASAKKFNAITVEAKEKLDKKWERLGGNVDKLNAAINAGKSKKTLACGKKCRAKAGKNPQLPTEATSDFINFTDPVTVAIIGAVMDGKYASMVGDATSKRLNGALMGLVGGLVLGSLLKQNSIMVGIAGGVIGYVIGNRKSEI